MYVSCVNNLNSCRILLSQIDVQITFLVLKALYNSTSGISMSFPPLGFHHILAVPTYIIYILRILPPKL